MIPIGTWDITPSIRRSESWWLLGRFVDSGSKSKFWLSKLDQMFGIEDLDWDLEFGLRLVHRRHSRHRQYTWKWVSKLINWSVIAEASETNLIHVFNTHFKRMKKLLRVPVKRHGFNLRNGFFKMIYFIPRDGCPRCVNFTRALGNNSCHQIEKYLTQTANFSHTLLMTLL